MSDTWLTTRYDGESRLDPLEPDDGLQQWIVTLVEQQWPDDGMLDEAESTTKELLRAFVLVWDRVRLARCEVDPFEAMDAHSADTLAVYEHVLHREPGLDRAVIATDIAAAGERDEALVDRHGAMLLRDLTLTLPANVYVVLATPDQATVYLREEGFAHLAQAIWVRRS